MINGMAIFIEGIFRFGMLLVLGMIACLPFVLVGGIVLIIVSGIAHAVQEGKGG
jgi:predicted RND superfamily exporter protein